MIKQTEPNFRQRLHDISRKVQHALNLHNEQWTRLRIEPTVGGYDVSWDTESDGRVKIPLKAKLPAALNDVDEAIQHALHLSKGCADDAIHLTRESATGRVQIMQEPKLAKDLGQKRAL